MSTSTKAGRRYDRGFSLVEMLVALLALSIGLLGMAGLQLTGLKNNLNSSLRSQATYLCYDLLDRIRANRQARADYEVAYEVDAAPGNVVAAQDLDEWRAALESTLPGGEGEVEVDGAGDTEITVRVRWDDSRGADPEKMEFTMETQL